LSAGCALQAKLRALRNALKTRLDARDLSGKLLLNGARDKRISYSEQGVCILLL
jgi:hypothetical protein